MNNSFLFTSTIRLRTKSNFCNVFCYTIVFIGCLRLINHFTVYKQKNINLDRVAKDQNDILANNTKIELDCNSKLGNPGDFAIIPLISLPGAGNTWVRFLIEQATGIATGSTYNDGSLAKSLIGEKRNPMGQETIVIKSHSINRIRGKYFQVPQDQRPKIKGCILVIRSPRDAILAEFIRKNTRSHTGILPDLRELLSKSDEWQKTSTRTARGWYGLYQQAVTFCDGQMGQPSEKLGGDPEIRKKGHFVIVYETLKESPEKLISVMKNVTNYINSKNDVNHQVPFREKCLIKNFEGNYHRKNSREWDVAEFFTIGARKSINKGVEIVRELFTGMIPESYWIDLSNWSDRKRRELSDYFSSKMK